MMFLVSNVLDFGPDSLDFFEMCKLTSSLFQQDSRKLIDFLPLNPSLNDSKIMLGFNSMFSFNDEIQANLTNKNLLSNYDCSGDNPNG